MNTAPNEVLDTSEQPKIPQNIENFANQEFPKLQTKINHEAMQTQSRISVISQETRLKFLGLSISTSNDNHVNAHGKFTGRDDNFTAGFSGDLDLMYNDTPINIHTNYDIYTNAPMYVRKNGTIRRKNGDWLTHERVDRASITATATKNIFQKNNTSVNMKYGGGFSYTGDLGGDKIQNKWHDMIGVNYHVEAPYEKWWIGGHMNLWIDARQKLGEYIYAWVKMDWQANIFGSGSTSLDSTAYAWIQGKYAWIEGGISKRLFANDTSPTIRAVQTGTGDVHQYIRATLGTENTKLFYETTTKDKGYGTIGLRFTRSF